MNKYQVAIIGTNIGAKHYEDFQKVKERFNVHTLCGLTREAIDNILSNIPKQKVGIYLLENQAWEKSLISSWNKFNHGGLIGVAHSTIRFWDLRYFRSKNTDIICRGFVRRHRICFTNLCTTKYFTNPIGYNIFTRGCFCCNRSLDYIISDIKSK